jgi:hypothetical protein
MVILGRFWWEARCITKNEPLRSSSKIMVSLPTVLDAYYVNSVVTEVRFPSYGHGGKTFFDEKRPNPNYLHTTCYLLIVRPPLPFAAPPPLLVVQPLSVDEK